MHALNAQTLGSVAVIAAFAAAELAAHLLALHPASALLWYLNLEVFGDFERARAAHSPLRFLFGPAALPGALALLALALLARLRRHHLGVAAIANLSFAAAVALLLLAGESSGPLASAGDAVVIAHRLDRPLPLVLALGAFAAFAASHASFIGRVVAERRAAP